MRHAALHAFLRAAMTQPALPVLHVGCGNSDLCDGLGAEGTPVVNVDISAVVVDQMRAAAAAAWPAGAPARVNCSWEVADCRRMPQYGDEAFGTVLDKGTLDAVLCSGTGLGDVRSYVSEAHRLLAPGGAFVLISLGAPEARLGVLRALPRRRRPSSADTASAPLPLWADAWADAGLPGGAAAIAAAAAAAGAAGGRRPSRLASQVAAAAAPTAAAAAAAAAAPPAGGRREVRWARALVYLLPKPALYMASEASVRARSAAVARPAAAGAAPAAAAAAAAAAATPAIPVPGSGSAPANADAGGQQQQQQQQQQPPPPPRPRHSTSKDDPVAWLGPYEPGADLEAALAGVDAADFFFCYVLVKPAAGPRSRRASALGWPGAAAAAALAAGGSGLSVEPPVGAAAVAAAAAAVSALAGGGGGGGGSGVLPGGLGDGGDGAGTSGDAMLARRASLGGPAAATTSGRSASFDGSGMSAPPPPPAVRRSPTGDPPQIWRRGDDA